MKAQPDLKDRFVIIMAGGRGERFWPLSREKRPKQLLTLLGKKSFLQSAVDRVLPLVPAKNIFVITNAAQLPEVRKQLPKIPKANLVAEPIGRDTCAAVTLGAALVGARSTTGVMAVLPADHVIPDEKKFQQVLGDAFDGVTQGRAIVTIGIKPAGPDDGLRVHSHRPGITAGPRREENENRLFQARNALSRNPISIGRWNTSTAASIAGTPGCLSGVS
jgi:mannose-1-phosphate guanylyltransferase